MISTSSMIPGKNGPHTPPSHGILKNGIPHGMHPQGGQLMDGRLRMDAQKFLVPSLPLSSARHEQVNVGLKRKEQRSLLNGNMLQEPRENGRRYEGHHMGQQSQQHSPRQRESVSPYSEMLHPSHPLLNHAHQLSANQSNYQLSRPSVTIPCSSPGAPSSVSPQSMSPSSKGSSNGHSSSYSPGSHGEINLSSRLYPPSSPNGYPHHAMGMQSHHAQAAFFAAAAAAAAGSPYPLFGGPYAPHSHSAASSYLDSFHSNILAQQQQLKLGGSGGGGGGPPSSTSYIPQHLRIPYHPHVTSTTSLHTKLIESSSERYNGHAHLHHPGLPNRNGEYSLPGLPGISKGGPLGMGPLEPPIHQLSGGHGGKKPLGQGQGGGKESSNSSRSQWNERERDHLAYGQPAFNKTSPPGGSPPHQYDMRAEHKPPLYPTTVVNRENRGEAAYRQQRAAKMSLEAVEDAIQAKLSKHRNVTSNIFTFPPEVPLAHRNGHMNGGSGSGGRQEKDVGPMGLDLQTAASLGHVQNPFQAPGSPQKRKSAGSNGQIQWGFAPPLSPSRTALSAAESGKYLKLSKTHSVPSSPSYLRKSPGLPLPQSPSYYKVPKSPSVTFKTGPKVPPSPRRVLQAHNENHVNSRSLLLAPMPIEEMPVLEAFRQGSLIQLASGEVKSVENLCGEDFTHSAAQMVDSVKIIYCKVLAVQEIIPSRTSSSSPPFCKITLGMESHKQQFVLEATLEQPFFVLGRGWSSLSPEMSKRILQLQCSALQVGDICMTLAKTPKQQSNPQAKTRIQSLPSLKCAAPVKPAKVSVTSAAEEPRTSTSRAAATAVNEAPPPPTPSNASTTSTVESSPSRPATTSPASTAASVPSAPSDETVPKTLEVPNAETESHPSSPKKRKLSTPAEDSVEVKSEKTESNQSDSCSRKSSIKQTAEAD